MNALADPQMNATPLIDVLLVLLVMLVLTLPMATHAVKLNLPQLVDVPPSAVVTVNVEFDGQLYWNGRSVTTGQLEQHLRQAAASVNPPTVKVLPDKRVPYAAVAGVLASAQRLGIARLTVAPIF